MTMSTWDNTTRPKIKEESQGDVPIHHCLAAMGTARHLKLNKMGVVLRYPSESRHSKNMRVMPDAKKMAGMMIYIYWSLNAKKMGDKMQTRSHGTPDDIKLGRERPRYCSSCPHVLGVRPLGDDGQARVRLLGNGHGGERK